MARLLFGLLFLVMIFVPAQAAKRVALVVGNSAYEHVPELANPKNDAEAVANALDRLDFEVIKGIDLTQPDFVNKVREFSKAIRGADIALFYYAGHGLQVNGRNYLAPVETQLLDEADLDFEAVRLQMILSQMEREPRTNLVILDACRNNPLARNLAGSMGTRSAAVGRGLAPIESGVGTLIAFATQPGNVALDGEGSNSPFTSALVKHLDTPGEDIAVTLRRVRQDVITQTDGKQVPWSNSSLTGSVVLNESVNSDTDSDSDLRKQLAELQERLAAAERTPSVNNNGLQKPTAGTPPGKVNNVPPINTQNANTLNTDENDGNATETARLDLEQADTTSPSVKLDRKGRRDLQLALRQLGFDPGQANGEFGPETYQSILLARKQLGLPSGIHIDQALLNMLPKTQDYLSTFDGEWTITRIAGQPTECGWERSSQKLEITNGEISGPGYSGEIFRDNSVRFERTFILKHKKQKSTFSGTITYNEANGTFSRSDGKCEGKFSIYRGSVTERTLAISPREDQDLILSVQKHLNRLGCSVGSPDGVWGERSRRGLQNLRKFGGERFASADVSWELLDDLKRADTHVCPIKCPKGYLQTGSTCLYGAVPMKKRRSN